MLNGLIWEKGESWDVDGDTGGFWSRRNDRADMTSLGFVNSLGGVGGEMRFSVSHPQNSN